MIRRVTFMDDLIMIRKRSKGKELEAGEGGRGRRLKDSSAGAFNPRPCLTKTKNILFR